eukprot:tig00020875_g14893.t1
MGPAALRHVREHFNRDGRVDVTRLAFPAFLKALFCGPYGRDVDAARRLVDELGVAPRARFQESSIGPCSWVPPFFRDCIEQENVPEPLRAEGLTALHALVGGYYYDFHVDGARKVIQEWQLASLVDAPLRSGIRTGRTPLHLAVETPNPLLVTLLELGADPLRQDAAGSTALHIACKRANIDAVRSLLKFGAVPLCKVRLQPGSPELEAIASSLWSRPERTPRAPGEIDGRARVQDAAGATALHIACGRGHVDVARALLEWAAGAGAGADVLSARDGGGRTPLQRLVHGGSDDEPSRPAADVNASLIAIHAVQILELDGPRLEALGPTNYPIR